MWETPQQSTVVHPLFCANIVFFFLSLFTPVFISTDAHSVGAVVLQDGIPV